MPALQFSLDFFLLIYLKIRHQSLSPSYSVISVYMLSFIKICGVLFIAGFMASQCIRELYDSQGRSIIELLAVWCMFWMVDTPGAELACELEILLRRTLPEAFAAIRKLLGSMPGNQREKLEDCQTPGCRGISFSMEGAPLHVTKESSSIPHSALKEARL